MKKSALPLSLLVALGSATLLSLAAGCGSHTGPRDLMLEEAASGSVERPVAMRGETTFLEGKLAALATVSRGFDRGVRGPGVRGPGKKGGGPGDDNVFGPGGRRRNDEAGALPRFTISAVTATPRRSRRKRCKITSGKPAPAAPPAAPCRRSP